MDLFVQNNLDELLSERAGPCVSLYIPTQRRASEQERIRWRKAVGEATGELTGRGWRSSEARDFMAPVEKLLDDALLWQGLSDGLAAFRAPDFLRCYRLPRHFDEERVVGERFQITPLLPLLAGDGRFYVLAVSQNEVRLLCGTRSTIGPIDLRNAPASLADALKFDDKYEPLTYHTVPGGRKGGWAAIFHGQGVGIDDHKDDLLRYFQGIDHALREALRNEKAPLVLATVDYLMPIYRQANRYPHLWKEGVSGSPDRISDQELHDRAWPLVEPFFREDQEKAVAQYRQFAGTGRTSTDVAEVVTAAARGKVEALLVARGEKVWGQFDPDTQEMAVHGQAESNDEDLVNLAAIQVLRHGKPVYALDRAEMPSDSPLAAVVPFPLARLV
jgi:hypothetical protein